MDRRGYCCSSSYLYERYIRRENSIREAAASLRIRADHTEIFFANVQTNKRNKKSHPENVPKAKISKGKSGVSQQIYPDNNPKTHRLPNTVYGETLEDHEDDEDYQPEEKSN